PRHTLPPYTTLFRAGGEGRTVATALRARVPRRRSARASRRVRHRRGRVRGSCRRRSRRRLPPGLDEHGLRTTAPGLAYLDGGGEDRESTRLNSSHQI